MFRPAALLFGLVLLMASCNLPSVTPPPAPETPATAPAPPAPHILAHYMPWFRMEPRADGTIAWEHWQWFGRGPKHDPDRMLENGRRDIASVFYPLIGPYDGRDPHVLEYHLLTARAAGIEGFMADWYGPGTRTDDIFSLLLAAAARYGMTAAICLEEKSCFPEYAKVAARAEAMDLLETQIRHVLDQHARSPAYVRVSGKPLFYIFNSHGDGALGRHVFSPEEIRDILQRFASDELLLARTNFDPPFVDVVKGYFAWVGDATYREWFYPTLRGLKQEGRVAYWAGSANPGFDDSGVHGWGTAPRFTDRRGTAEFEEAWRCILEYRPDAVQVVTWNDFEEGTTIEPAEEYGFTFVDLTEKYVGELTGRPVNLDDNPWGWRIYQMRKKLAGASAPGVSAELEEFVEDFVRGTGAANETRLARIEQRVADSLEKGANP